MPKVQPWDFFGRKDAKAETPVLWPPHAKTWLIGKDSDAGRDWGQEEKGTTEDEMAGCHHQLDGRESEWTPGVGDGQGGLACCNSWGRKQSDMTERLNWTELKVENIFSMLYFTLFTTDVKHKYVYFLQLLYFFWQFKLYIYVCMYTQLLHMASAKSAPPLPPTVWFPRMPFPLWYLFNHLEELG